MDRCHVSMVAAMLLILLLALTLRAACQPGFQSINCGGEAYKDAKTNITWDEDPFNQSGNAHNALISGKVGKVNSTTHVMATLRYFPVNSRNAKFCYTLGQDFGGLSGHKCLLRASFLYGNYDGLNQPPHFLLMLNSDLWTTVNTSSSPSPKVYELIFVSNQDVLSICLAPSITSNHTPFLSTLELRIFENSMYNATASYNSPGGIQQGYGLLLWKRINYGSLTQADIRYPDDPYDRIWEANTTGPIVSAGTNKVGTYYGVDPEMPPAEVMSTAITTTNSTASLTFTYDGFGGFGGFFVEMHFQEVDEKASLRSIDLEVSGKIQLELNLTILAPYQLHINQIQDFPFPFQFTLLRGPASLEGPLLNAIELSAWTPRPLAMGATFRSDVVAIMQIQARLNLTGYGQGDPCTPENHTWTWIECDNSIPKRIININLASLNLTGQIPSYVGTITSLKSIDLSNNMLSGQIPDVSLLLYLENLDLHSNKLIGELPSYLLELPNLAKLDVSDNNFCGNPPALRPSINFTYIGNDRLCDGCNCSSSNSRMTPILITKRTHANEYVIAISIISTLYVVSIMLMLVVILFVVERERRKRAKAVNKKGVDDLRGLTFMSKIFTYDEIKSATKDFTTVLGEGGFGKVYHGLLPTGEAIAVKSLTDASKQGLKEFYNEVAILSRVRHKSLVSLIGYCVDNTYMLIYEYIAKGNLRELIYGDTKSLDKPLPWSTRLCIAHDAAQGLEYLHMGCDPAIIHRDVKSSNILLSERMQAKVSDFGLSRLKQADNAISHVSTANVVGTPGYLDPEYNSTNQLTDKSDVYSFGVVLFELICGRAPIDMFNTPTHIVEWAKQAIMQGKFVDIVDPILENGYKVESMSKVIELAFTCTENERIKRPKMSEVAQLLQQALEIEMDQNIAITSQDTSGSSSTSKTNPPTIQFLESIHMNFEPR